MAAFRIEAVGRVSGGRDEAVDDDWGSSRARIELDPDRFTPEAFAGLAEFSHAEIVFLFDRIGQGEVELGARHPRGREDWPKVGIFAQRGRNRPGRIGVSICRIVAVEGIAMEVEGLDAIDGTPVLDVKPVMRGFLPRGEVREPDWARQIMEQYW
jgi:tRNA (Thr-GGU) A37 N-methylase